MEHYWSIWAEEEVSSLAGHLRAEDNSHKLILIPVIFPTTLSTPTSTLEMTIIHILMMTVLREMDDVDMVGHLVWSV